VIRPITQCTVMTRAPLVWGRDCFWSAGANLWVNDSDFIFGVTTHTPMPAFRRRVWRRAIRARAWERNCPLRQSWVPCHGGTRFQHLMPDHGPQHIRGGDRDIPYGAGPEKNISPSDSSMVTPAGPERVSSQPVSEADLSLRLSVRLSDVGLMCQCKQLACCASQSATH
jgi:hypothetical protein